MFYVISLIVVACGMLARWYLTMRLTKVTFDQSRDDQLKDGPFKEWLFEQNTYPLIGRDFDGYIWVLAYGYLGARRIKNNAKASGVGLK